jgi:prolyl oligopeptidase
VLKSKEASVAKAWSYPETRAEDVADVTFGTTVRDPYRWLEDGKAPAVQAWMKAQDDLTRDKLRGLPERDAIADRLRELFYGEAQGVPFARGDRLFYGRRSGTQEKAVVYVREADGTERVLLDPNTWPEHGEASLHGYTVSWDGSRVAYTVSENNSDEATLYVRDVASGALSTVDVIPGANYAHASWTPSGDGFYYVRLPVDPSIEVHARPGYSELRFHRLGTSPADDEVVHERTGDPSKFLGGWLSKDGRYLFAQVHYGWRSCDVYFKDMSKDPEAKGAAGWTPLAVGTDALYSVTSFRGQFYVATNEGAPRWRLFVVDPAAPERSAWREIVPERDDATLDSVQVIGGALCLTYLKDVTTRMELHDLQGKLLREIPLQALGSGGASGDPDRDEAYYWFETYTLPREIHAFSVARGTSSLFYGHEVPVDPEAYVVEQIFFGSKDGTRVPMFVVHAKTTPRDGTASAILSGYGGFNASETPAFRRGIFPWLERGGVYAVANLRGGGEYGEGWHRAGMGHQKERVFEDFEAAAEALVAAKLTSHERLVISGGSNGGLLVGAVMTRRPSICRVVACAVPLLDMVRYTLCGAGRTWIEEYGDPAVEADFRVLYAYSPYHHVTPGTAYPSVLFDAADSDDRVDPMHARKLAAALQAASTGGPVLLRVERNAGHGGADRMRAWVERYADQYAFFLAEIREQGGVMGKKS